MKVYNASCIRTPALKELPPDSDGYMIWRNFIQTDLGVGFWFAILKSSGYSFNGYGFLPYEDY